MDQKSYQKMFDQIHMPAQRAGEVRRELAARRAQNKLEVTDMTDNSRNNRRPIAAILTVCAVAVLTVTAFASGGLEHIIKMMTVQSEETVQTEETVSPVELREDGRLYLTINGENRDITDECSYETPYVYECEGEDGLRHIFIIGGGLEETGWVEYAVAETDGDSNGEYSSSSVLSCMVSSVPDGVKLETLPWLCKGLEQTTGSNPFAAQFELEPAGDSGEPGEPQVFHFQYGEGEVISDGVVTVTENLG